MSSLADIVLAVANGGAEVGQEPADIIDFVESSWGLHTRLYPVQKIILKAHYGIPLDDTEADIHISDWRRENWQHLTEAGYLRYLFDDGRSNIREVVPGEERRQMVLSIGRRSGKCILGDSLVLTDSGIVRIEDLGDPAGPEVQPLELGVVQEGGRRAQSKYFYNGGVKPTRTLTTRCGYRLGGTGNHRIKVLTEQGVVAWKHLADLEVGDVVCIHRNTNLWASDPVDCTPFHNTKGYKDLTFPFLLDEQWGRLLGYLVGDGLWNYKGRVEITVEHPETWETLKALYTELFGGYSVSMDKRTENTGALKFNSVGMRKFLSDLGFQLGTARDAKMVPWSILQSPRPVVQAFLRGLFEADGGVEAGGKTVSFSTASGRLAREVQTLLLNLGVVSRIKPKTIKDKVYWLLSVQGRRSRLAFAELVGFDSRKKQTPLMASFQSAKEGGAAESIPHQRQWAQRLLESVPKVQPVPGQKQPWNRSKLRAVLGNTIKPSAFDEMTYPRLTEALPVARAVGADGEVLAHFGRLQKLDYFFDPVMVIEDGQNPVYDLNVPDGESFVANGMTNHNTFISACIVAYEVYKLLLKGNPQGYYGLGSTSEIGLVSVATAQPQAGLLYAEASGHFAKCGFFGPYTANNTMTYAKFQSPGDIKRFGRYKDNNAAKATIKVTFASCIAKGLRGPGNMLIILDELAHFNDVGQSDAKTVFDAITPSIATFSPKDPEDSRIPIGPVEGRIISISSPMGRSGFFYELFQLGYGGGPATQNMLCIQAPTWEVNPTIPQSWFELEFAKDPAKFFTEYGAAFTSRTKGWIENEADLVACIDPKLRPKRQAVPRMPHFAGIDLGLKGNGTALAIGHIDGENRIVLDFLEEIKAGEGKFEGVDRLDFDEVVDWVWKLSRKFYIVEGMFDMWAGIPFEQALLKKGLRQFKAEHMTKNKNSDIWRNAKDMMWDERLVLFDWPIEGNKAHCGYIQELLELEATHHSKHVTTVEAPNVKGKFDDQSDALVRMIWLASRQLSSPKYISKAGKGGSAARHSVAARALDSSIRKARLKARRGGSSPERQRPRQRRRF